jgi:hypothetical protein
VRSLSPLSSDAEVGPRIEREGSAPNEKVAVGFHRGLRHCDSDRVYPFTTAGIAHQSASADYVGANGTISMAIGTDKNGRHFIESKVHRMQASVVPEIGKCQDIVIQHNDKDSSVGEK